MHILELQPQGHESSTAAQQSVHRTAGGLRILSLIQARNWFGFVSWFSPAAGNAGRWADAYEQSVVGSIEMKQLSWLSLLLIPVLASAGCTPVRPTIQPPVITVTKPATQTELVSQPTDTPSPTITLTPFDTLAPIQVTETLQPLVKDPMNCAVPCFWGIIPGKTSLEEARTFFRKLDFLPLSKRTMKERVFIRFYMIPAAAMILV